MSPNDAVFPRIKGPTRSEKVKALLREEIAAGRLPPGTRLDEKILARRFAVSRTPVREALKALAAMGVVESRPRRGMVVAEATPRSVAEAYEALAEVEPIVARLCAERMNEDQRAGLMSLHQGTKAPPRQWDLAECAASVGRFHDLLAEGCGNTLLAETAKAMRLRALPSWRAQFTGGGDWLATGWALRGAVVAAVLDRDAEAAGRAMRGYLVRAGEEAARIVARRRAAAASSG